MTNTKNREELNNLMKECVEDARLIVQEKRLLESQAVLASIATTLFNARLDELKMTRK